MGVTLAQSTDAAFPDHGLGTTGLRATLTTGYGGGYISHTFDAAPSPLHVRFMLAPRTAAGGSAHLAGGWAGDGTLRWWVGYDADTATATLNMPGVAPLSGTLPSAFAWHSVEVAIDHAAGEAALHLNGHRVAQATGLTLGATDRCWLGVLSKSNTLAGVFDLDDWVIADAPIDPPRVTPTHDHAGDPARWLVVYNTDDTDSAAWAEHYRAARGVPYANLCGLALPTTETIDLPAYLALRDGVLGYLAGNGLADQVVGVLLGLGVPGYVDFAGIGELLPVASLLHTDGDDTGTYLNPLHRDPPADRPVAGAMSGVRFTGRIDGATLAEANALVDRATVLMNDPPLADSGATLWIDPVPEDAGINPLFTEPMTGWAEGDGPGTLRVPIRVADGTEFDAINHDLCFWGWGQASPPAGFFASPAGRRAISVQLAEADPPAASQRDPGATHWLRQAVDAGYAAASASSRAYSLSALPQPGVFFEALRRGWTLAEAWLLCQPFLRHGMQMVGDPLLSLAFPKSGYNLYGPATSLQAIDTAAPSVRLNDADRLFALPLEMLPDEGQAGVYLVRRVDALGRDDGGAASVSAQTLADGVVSPPRLPAWPDAWGWPARVTAGHIGLSAVWASPADTIGLARAVLEAETPGGVVDLVESPITAGTRWARVDALLPEQTVRLRWRIEADSGATAWTPWSATPQDSPAQDAGLTLYEVSP